MVSMKTSTLFCLKSAFLATLAIASTEEVEGPAITALAVAADMLQFDNSNKDQAELEKRLYYYGEEVYFYTRTDSAGTSYFCGLVETPDAVLRCMQYDYFTSAYASVYEENFGLTDTGGLSAYIESPASAEEELKTITSTTFVVPDSAIIAPSAAASALSASPKQTTLVTSHLSESSSESEAATTSQEQSTEVSTTSSRGEAVGSSQWASGFVGLCSLVAFAGLMI